MTARFIVGDVHRRMAELPSGQYDLIITSPPFLALRSYLPDGHPDKADEIGSEATPAAFLDVMLALTAEWGRLLAPHGSIAVEIGDTYSGSGGGGGDYSADGLRAGQPKFDGSGKRIRETRREGYIANGVQPPARRDTSDGWPLAKSLAMIPELYAASLAYGRNLLTGEPSPAGRWRVRNFKPWIRSNPPVGALGDKERPATSYVTVACRATDRYFDLDAVRTAHSDNATRYDRRDRAFDKSEQGMANQPHTAGINPAGAPPLDWWHQVDATINRVIDNMAGKPNGGDPRQEAQQVTGSRGDDGQPRTIVGAQTVGARGVHIRRALEAAGILTTADALDVSSKGYPGAHYAVWPPELVRLLCAEMMPRRVCTTCGQPSRRIVESNGTSYRQQAADVQHPERLGVAATGRGHDAVSERSTVGWSDCGHGTWRPGRLLDPFAGSGTTLAVATGMGYDADGIDLDERNADLARDRVGMFLEVTEAGEMVGQLPLPSA